MFCACTRLETTSSPTSNTFGNWTFCEYNFLLVIYSKQKSTAMNKINEKTPESHECKRQLHLQKQREQSRARLACETKEQRRQRRLDNSAVKDTSWTELSGWRNKQDRQSFAKISNFVFRDDVSKDEQGMATTSSYMQHAHLVIRPGIKSRDGVPISTSL